MSDRLAEVITPWRTFRLTLQPQRRVTRSRYSASGRRVRERDNASHYGWSARRRRDAVSLGMVLAGILFAGGRCAFALNPALDVGQYAHTAWPSPRGLFQGYNRRN